MAHLIGLQHDPVTEICDTRAPRVTQDSLDLKPAAQDWAQAQVHIPLRPDDELATASSGILESWPAASCGRGSWVNDSERSPVGPNERASQAMHELGDRMIRPVSVR